jgi:hypothetical protein
MAMSSRSIMWTLIEPPPPPPTERTRRELTNALVRSIRTDHSDDKRLIKGLDSLQAGNAFEFESPESLVPGSEGETSPFYAALKNLSRVGERRRPGRPPVRQYVDKRFVEAAVSQWLQDPVNVQQNLFEENDDLPDRLAEAGLLARSEKDLRVQELLDLAIPGDFCDDRKYGADLGLGAELGGARKICYGILRKERFEKSSLEATDPSLWHQRYPKFWLRSSVVPTPVQEEDGRIYQAGVLEEVVNLPNFGTFGPVLLTYMRTTDIDSDWSFVTYKLLNQDAMNVNQGWYLVRRRPGRVSAAIMLKLVEFKRYNDWLDSACETGLLDGARALLGVDRAGEAGPAPRVEGAGQGLEGDDGQELTVTRTVGAYLENCQDGWGQLATKNVNELKQGLADFEASPSNLGWTDNLLAVVDQSTSFLGTKLSDWVDLVQRDLPSAVQAAEQAARANRPAGNNSSGDLGLTTTSAIAAGLKTGLGIYKAGYDLSRAMLQVFGPGIGKVDTRLVDAIDRAQRSGGLPEELGELGVSDTDLAIQNMMTSARWAADFTEFHADVDRIVRIYRTRPPARNDPPGAGGLSTPENTEALAVDDSRIRSGTDDSPSTANSLTLCQRLWDESRQSPRSS